MSGFCRVDCETFLLLFHLRSRGLRICVEYLLRFSWLLSLDANCLPSVVLSPRICTSIKSKSCCTFWCCVILFGCATLGDASVLLTGPPGSTLFIYNSYDSLVSDLLYVKYISCDFVYMRHLSHVSPSGERDLPHLRRGSDDGWCRSLCRF